MVGQVFIQFQILPTLQMSIINNPLFYQGSRIETVVSFTNEHWPRKTVLAQRHIKPEKQIQMPLKKVGQLTRAQG